MNSELQKKRVSCSYPYIELTHLQKKIMEELKNLGDEITLVEISKETNIQISRLFRILNGYEMRLSEYISLDIYIKNKMAQE